MPCEESRPTLPSPYVRRKPKRQRNSERRKQPHVDGVPVLPEEEDATYYLRSVKEDGTVPVIGVYDADGNLIRTLNTPIYALPVGDRTLLEVGIAVSDAEELADLIEDFGG